MDAGLTHVHELLGVPSRRGRCSLLSHSSHILLGSCKRPEDVRVFRHFQASCFSVLEPTNSVIPRLFLQRNWRRWQFWREGESGSDRSLKNQPKNLQRLNSPLQEPRLRSGPEPRCAPLLRLRVHPSCRRGYGSLCSKLALSLRRLDDRRALQLLHGSAWPRWCACVGSVAAMVSSVHSCDGESKKKEVCNC